MNQLEMPETHNGERKVAIKYISKSSIFLVSQEEEEEEEEEEGRSF